MRFDNFLIYRIIVIIRIYFILLQEKTYFSFIFDVSSWCSLRLWEEFQNFKMFFEIGVVYENYYIFKALNLRQKPKARSLNPDLSSTLREVRELFIRVERRTVTKKVKFQTFRVNMVSFVGFVLLKKFEIDKVH